MHGAAVSPAGLEIRRPMLLSMVAGRAEPSKQALLRRLLYYYYYFYFYYYPHRGGGTPPPGANQTHPNRHKLIFPIGKRIVSATRRSWEGSPGHDGPSWPQDGPKMAQDGPRWPQDGPKMAPGRPRMAPR